jgi:hypothetical protein
MNTLLNTTVNECSGYGNYNKRELPIEPESFFNTVLYDVWHSLGLQDLERSFHPVVDEFTELPLKELLELSHDYLIDQEEENNMSNSLMLNPIPLNVPYGQNVATDATSQAYTEHVDPMQMVNKMQPIMDHTERTQINEGNITTTSSTSCQKRRREEPLTDESGDAFNNDDHFRPYQTGQWVKHFNDLCIYRGIHGNCLVPHIYTENLPLAHWVKRQRYQYKLMIEGKPSAMSQSRVIALEEVGFAWYVKGAAWGERLDELKEFRSIHMHCRVPSNYSVNQQLASWVKCQRRQYKLHLEGKPSYMTPQRILNLEAIGFEWLLRSSKEQRTM